ncbi:hypothetical protein C7M61_004548 [Candidozyma pseudohaemuli]|uniref:Uncharacterized protein n=1 Tax=Candidozyma pseudohaemuli TaxID=418784 RepID=A0A2P7YHR9_9ASCO|nr:hypothetical protein C7M61_004548 [[Candida] pseudohaemulonii]PSK35511.1 hypothetical protein C7M61_004548 [[Candida] pseudohaemulonii]
MKLSSQRAAPAESPPQKLTTIFQFRNFRRDFTRQLDDIVGAVNEQVFSFRTIGLLLQGEHHQVTEFVVKTPDLADDPDLKLHVEKARTRNGVTSFGAGPNFANNMLVFEVLHTYHTFDWSDLEMPMPIVGRCVLAVGEERQIFPGPKFPMSHQLYGFGSELEKGSTHYHALSGGSVEFEANFEQVPWIRQEPYSRIVLPGMYVPSFLSLSVIVAHRRILNMLLEEPLHLTNIRVEFQEFSCVPNKYLQSTEVRSKVLVDKKISMEIFRVNWLLTIPDTFYDCVIPKVGPTFFTEGFIRTYGLKITVALSHKSGPSFNASAFVEINVAQEKYEKIHEKDIFNPRYMGTDGIETCYGTHSSLKPFQTSEPTDNSLSSFSRLNADEATGNPPNPEATGGLLELIRNQATNLLSQLTFMSDSAEELHSQLVTSDYPIWDYVDFRKNQLLQTTGRLSRNQYFELQQLYEIDDSLWSGKFLGGDHPAKAYLFLQVDNSEGLKKTWDSLKDIIKREEELMIL